MATRPARTPQQRDAHELARTPQANPYRGSMLDPFTTNPPPASDPAAKPNRPAKTDPVTEGRRVESSRPAGSGPRPVAPWAPTGTPAAATTAGILGLALGVVMALFGISLLAL